MAACIAALAGSISITFPLCQIANAHIHKLVDRRVAPAVKKKDYGAPYLGWNSDVIDVRECECAYAPLGTVPYPLTTLARWQNCVKNLLTLG